MVIRHNLYNRSLPIGQRAVQSGRSSVLDSLLLGSDLSSQQTATRYILSHNLLRL